MVGPFDREVLGLYGGLQTELQGDIEPLKRIQKVRVTGLKSALHRKVRSYTRRFSAVKDLNGSLGIIVKNRIQHREALYLRSSKHRELFLQPMAVKPLMLETYARLAVLAERALERAPY